MTQFTPRKYLLKQEVQGFYMRLPLQLETPPDLIATHIPKGNYTTSKTPTTIQDVL